MKKIIVLGVAFALFTFAASAQKGSTDLRDKRDRKDFKTGQLTHAEKSRLQKNDFRYKKTERRFKRDGRLTPMEKRKLSYMKRHDRHDKFRFKHNDRKRHGHKRHH